MNRELTLNDLRPLSETTAVAIKHLRFEHHREAFGIGEAAPRLSWQVETAAAGWTQAGYELELYTPEGELQESTGPVHSQNSVLVAWPFRPLVSRQAGLVRLRVWGQAENPSAWSQLFVVETGLLQAEDWSALFVTPAWQEDTSRQNPCPLLRREFNLKNGIARARLYVTSLGLNEVYLNGSRVGDHLLSPGWTSYNHRLRYQTYEVTGQLKAGPNALGALLADGWYRGLIGFEGGSRNIYGDKLALLAQLEVEYDDGTTQEIVTDPDWRAATGPFISSGIYEGETYDARLEKPGWAAPGFDDSAWSRVRIHERNLATLVAPQGPPVRRIERRSPVAITTSPAGKILLDFGQNLVGWLRITVQGEAGQTIVLRHAEVLENGELGTRPLREAAATDTYILRGGGVESWEPHFTFHGFRYAQVEDWPGELQPEDIQAIVCHSDMERTGTFECSDPLLNRLHENVVWGMRGNFFDLPTDCPQRDERLGWTGDIQVFAPTASFLYDCAGFLSSWLGDLAAEQKEEGGSVPVFVPKVPTKFTNSPLPAAAWGDAAVIVPWVLYQRFGDTEILAAQVESMRSWVDTVTKLAGETLLWDQGFQFGDWLDPTAPPDDPAAAQTPTEVVATAYFAHSAELVGKTAGILGQLEQEKYYLALASRVKQAFEQAYVSREGQIKGDSVTAYALGLEFELLSTETQRRYAARRLAELVEANGYRISTGFVGTPLICDALTNAGDLASAYRLILQQECPSWLYSVTMGATTIWERWDSMLPDGSINPGDMTSFNHYALGAVADWLHRTVAGLIPASPGYSNLEIRPQPGGNLTWARARHLTPYGPAEVYWSIKGSQIEVKTVIPPNTSATVFLPGKTGNPLVVTAGKHSWTYHYR